MSDAFDPYLKWFGIPPAARPIHHYRLLGIEVFETDPEVIENATDQRMTHLKRFSTGQHVTLAEKLLNEVAAARVCLLNPDKKAKYDEELRLRLSGQATASFPVPPGFPPPESAAHIPVPPPPPQWASAPAPAGQFVFPAEESSPRATASGLKGHSKQQKSSSGWLAALAVLGRLGGHRGVDASYGRQSAKRSRLRRRQSFVADADGSQPEHRRPIRVPLPPSSGRRRNRLRRRWRRSRPKVRPASPAEGRAAKALDRESAAGQKTPVEPTSAAKSAKSNPRRQPESLFREADSPDESPSAEKSSKSGFGKKKDVEPPKEDEPAAESKKLSPPDAAIRRRRRRTSARSMLRRPPPPRRSRRSSPWRTDCSAKRKTATTIPPPSTPSWSWPCSKPETPGRSPRPSRRSTNWTRPST